MSHWDITKWFVYLSIWGKSEKGQAKSEEPTVVTPAEQWLGEVPEAIEEIPLLDINEKNSLHNLWAQGMNSDCLKVGQGTHQMMTSTWFSRYLSNAPLRGPLLSYYHSCPCGPFRSSPLDSYHQPLYSHHFHLGKFLLFWLLGKGLEEWMRALWGKVWSASLCLSQTFYQC